MKIIVLLSLLACLQAATSYRRRRSRKKNSHRFAPPHLQAHVFIYANGSVPIDTESGNEFSNNALEGTPFLKNEMGFSDEKILEEQQNAIDFWKENFGVDGGTISPLDGVMLRYQIAPAVNERAFFATNPCSIPSEGYKVLDGGFQLFITNEDGITVNDPMNPGSTVHYPFRTNFVYSWLRILTKAPCRRRGGDPPVPPEVIIMPYQTLRPALWTLQSIAFDLTIRAGNYFGEGVAIGQSAPIVNRATNTIFNRLSDYIEITGPFGND